MKRQCLQCGKQFYGNCHPKQDDAECCRKCCLASECVGCRNEDDNDK